MARLKFTQRLSRALDLPADGMLPVPRLEITGREDVLITGGAVLLEYAPEEIRLERAGCRVTIRGRDLNILGMDGLGMQISGHVAGVDFEE